MAIFVAIFKSEFSVIMKRAHQKIILNSCKPELKSHVLVKKITYFFLFVMTLATVQESKAQKNEVGIMLGGSTFYGDVGYTRAEQSLGGLDLAYGFLYRRNINNHFAWRLGITNGNITGNDADADNDYIKQRGLSFRSNILEFSAMLEFNFFRYGVKNRDRSHTPFVFAGVSRFFFSPEAQDSEGKWVSLQSLGTEGQGTSLGGTKYSLNAWAIPFGLGYKVNLGDHFCLSAEWGWRYTTTDYLDDASTTYADASILEQENGSIAAALADPTGVGVTGKQRAEANNNDWFAFTGISLTYRLPDRNNKCPKLIY
mgnify:CR=1 FL=1